VQSGRARLADAHRSELSWESRFDLAYNAAGEWRVLALAHERRNAAEYSGEYDVDERLLAEVVRVAKLVLTKLEQAGPPK
jgi:hypothetical protein